MGSGIVLLNIFSLLIIVILSIVFFTKQRLHKNEDNLYGKLLVYSVFANVFGLLFGLLMEIEHFNVIITLIFNKIYLAFLIIILLTFSFYTFCISKNRNEYFKEAKVIYYVMIITSIILLTTLPVQLVNINGVLSINGPAFYFTILDFIIIYTCLIVLLLLDYKHIYSKKYIPIILLLIGGIVIAAVQMIIPNANYIINPSIAITLLIMYFTIENPDVKMLEELYRNKKIIDDMNEENSRLLFQMTGNIKKEITDINSISKNINVNSLSKEEMGILFKEINNNVASIDYIVNNTLNITSMDVNKLRVFGMHYNIKRLFNGIYRTFKPSLSNIEFNYSMAKNVPTYLIGDNILLKQAIISILKESRKRTNKGFINLEVNAIVKYNVCRLIITIEDSGKAINIDQINDILSFDSDKVEINKIDSDQELDMFDIKKIINMIGGSFMIKSDKNEGTIVTITLDQKIIESKRHEFMKTIDKYEQELLPNKKVLLIDDDPNEIKKIEEILTKQDIIVNSTIFDNEAMEKITNGVKYDLIIIDDELIEKSALSFLNKLKTLKKFDIPVIVMLNDNKIKIKSQYVKDGFANYILKSKLEVEIKRIINQYL